MAEEEILEPTSSSTEDERKDLSTPEARTFVEERKALDTDGHLERSNSIRSESSNLGVRPPSKPTTPPSPVQLAFKKYANDRGLLPVDRLSEFLQELQILPTRDQGSALSNVAGPDATELTYQET